MTRVAVTGAAGYVGSALVSAAAAAPDIAVTSIVRGDVPWLPGESVVIDDLETDARRAVEGAEVVVHLAGPNEVEAAADPVGSIASALSAAHAVAVACADAGVRRLIYLSTVHVYGAALQPGAKVSELTVPEPRRPYAIARLAGEHLIAGVAGSTEVVFFRLTNSVGAPAAAEVDRWTLVTNDLCRQAYSVGHLQLRSDGQDWRDFIALDDVTRIILAATDSDRVPAGTYNLGSGEPMTVRQLSGLIIEEFEAARGDRLELRAVAGRAAPPAPYLVDVSKLGALGLSAEVPIGKAIADTLAFCRSQPAS